MITRLIRHSAVRYLIAGGASFLVDLGLLALFSQVLGMPMWLATAAAFLLSFFFTYTVQRVFAFESAAPHGMALVKYGVLVAFNTLASVAIVALFDLLGGGGWVLGKVVSTVVLVIWNYFAYRYWVFAGPAAKETSA